MDKMHKEAEVKSGKIVLEGDLILKNMDGIYQKLLSGSDVENNVEIEFRNIQKWDVSGIQLLYSFKRHYALHDKTISFAFATAEQATNSKEWMDLLNYHV